MSQGDRNMKRAMQWLLALSVVIALAVSVRVPAAVSFASGDNVGDHAPVFPNFFVRDVVVSNTNRRLQDTDAFKNSEPAIAINPRHPDEIVVSAFSGGWALPDGSPSNSPLWYSKSGGAVWTKVFSIPPPNKVGAVRASPCDQTFDYDRNGNLYGTFLVDPRGSATNPGECSKLQTSVEEGGEGNGIFSGATTDPAKPSAWKWFLDEKGVAQKTSALAEDQPWLIAAPDAGDLARDKVYVAYQGPACREVGTGDMGVAAADATVPPNFPLDKSVGCSNRGNANPGHRAAADPRTGAVYILYGNPIGTCDTPVPLGQAVELEYKLNRSTDGGETWSLGNQPLGTVVAQACSDQSVNINGYSFGVPEPGSPDGRVNLLKGGIHSLAVDPQNGAVYVVYGAFDDEAERDQLKIVRVTSDGGDVKISVPILVSPAHQQAALPAVAVTENGTVGVLYDTADGLAGDDPEHLVPTFSAHLAVSRDHGQTFSDSVILHFRSPVQTDADRLLGDYQQLKALGNTFYGVFSANGHDMPRGFNRKTNAIDPIFFKTDVR
jgi:hypothetical protein